MALLVTCEHASAAVPARWRPALRGAAAALRSHRGWDPGAQPFATALARRLDAPLVLGRVSRLLVDLNRSPHNPRRFSAWSRALPRHDRDVLDATVHAPHFAAALQHVREATRPVLHIAVHSFDPTLTPDRAGLDVGILYDPARAPERDLAAALASRLRAAGLVVRRNHPYRGVADGLPTWLRRRIAPDRYVGFELELSQAWSTDPRLRTARVPIVADAVAAIIAGG